MAADPVFVDTNILIYACRPAAAQHKDARTALQRLQDEGRPLWISPQVLREYLAVVTRSQPAAPMLPMTEALADVRHFATLFNLTGEGAGVMNRLLQLLAVYLVSGKQVHDANLVATMLDEDIHELLTFNSRDFARFSPLVQLVTIGFT